MKINAIEVVESKIDIDLSSVLDNQTCTLSVHESRVPVVDQVSNQLAGESLREIKATLTGIGAAFAPYEAVVAEAKRKIEAVRRSIVATREDIERPFRLVEDKLRAAVTGFAESERRRLAAEAAAEQARVRRAAEEAARIAAEELRARVRREAEEAALARAVELEAAGMVSEAAAEIDAVDATVEAVVEQAPAVPVYVPTIAAAQPQKLAGVTISVYYRYRATSERLDPAYETVDDLGFLVPDHKRIRAAVTSLKDKTTIRGVEVYTETRSAVR